MPDGQIEEGEQDRRGITRAAGLLGGLTLLSRVSGLIRDMVISAVFGASSGADAFFVAFRIPNLFRRVVGEGAASAAFVPVFTREIVDDGPDAMIRAARSVGAAAFLILSGLVACGVLLADPLVSAFAPGFVADPVKRDLTVTLTRYTFPYLGLVGAAAWAMGALHTFRRFVAPALGPILLNVSIVACALTVSPWVDPPVLSLVCGVLIGGALQFIVQIPTLRGLGMRLLPLPRPSHAATARVGALLLPVLFGGAVYQVNILVATIFASLLPERSISYLWYADRVFEFPLGLVAVAVGTAALPALSAQAKAGAHSEMGKTVGHSLKLTWALCLPAGVGIWMLAPQVVEVLFERGRFSPVDTVNTAWALRAYVFGIVGVATVRVLTAAFYAMEKPRITVYAALVALFVNAVFDLALMGPIDPELPWWGAEAIARFSATLRLADLRHAGLALSTGIAASVNAVLLLAWLKPKLPSLCLRELAASLGLHAAAAAFMAAALAVLLRSFEMFMPQAPAALLLVVAISSGALSYLVAIWAFGSSELKELSSMLAFRRP